MGTFSCWLSGLSSLSIHSQRTLKALESRPKRIRFVTRPRGTRGGVAVTMCSTKSTKWNSYSLAVSITRTRARTSATRIGNFLKARATKFSFQSSQNIWWLFELFWRMYVLSKKMIWLLGQLLDKNWAIFIATSGRTGRDVAMKSCDTISCDHKFFFLSLFSS